MSENTPVGAELDMIGKERERLRLYRDMIDEYIVTELATIIRANPEKQQDFFDAMLSIHRIRFNAETRVNQLLWLTLKGVKLPARTLAESVELLGVREVYVVMSTHPNESAVEVHGAHLTMEGAEQEMNGLNDDGEELDVWIRRLTLEE